MRYTYSASVSFWVSELLQLGGLVLLQRSSTPQDPQGPSVTWTNKMYILSIWQPWECPHSPPPPRSIKINHPFGNSSVHGAWGVEAEPHTGTSPRLWVVRIPRQSHSWKTQPPWWANFSSRTPPYYTAFKAATHPSLFLSFTPGQTCISGHSSPGFPPPPYFLSSGLSPNKNPSIFNLILAVAAQRTQTTTKCFTIFQMCKSAGIINTNA